MTPGYCSFVRPTSFSFVGIVTGSRALGFTSPHRMSARAWPHSRPGENMSSTASTCSAHGSKTGPGFRPTTIDLADGLVAAATAVTSASCPPEKERLGRSRPSEELSPTTIITTSAAAATATARSGSLPASYTQSVDAAVRLQIPCSGEIMYVGVT